jgi:hypothetical protein
VAHEVCALGWVAVQLRHRDDTIRAEGAEILPQLAPREQHARLVRETQLNWPSSAKVATMASVSKAFTARMCSATMPESF